MSKIVAVTETISVEYTEDEVIVTGVKTKEDYRLVLAFMAERRATNKKNRELAEQMIPASGGRRKIYSHR